MDQPGQVIAVIDTGAVTMTTLQVLCRYEDDPSVGNFWVTMDELANALSALQTTVPDGADDAQDDAPPPKYSTYKWRVEAIGGHHDNWTYAALYACDAIPVSGDTHKRVLDALAAMTQRAHAAEGERGALQRDLEAAHAELAELAADRDAWREERQRLAVRLARACAVLEGENEGPQEVQP